MSPSLLKLNISGNQQNRNIILRQKDLNNKKENKEINNIKVRKLKSKPSFNFDSDFNNKDLNSDNSNSNNVSTVSTSILQKLSKKADKLIIRIVKIESSENIKLEINSVGMIKNSERNAQDGFTFFGIINEQYKNDKYKNVDYNLDTNDTNNRDNNDIIGRHFYIKFDINTMKYYIKDLGSGYGTFRKIVRKEKLIDNHFLSIGNSYLISSFEDNDSQEERESCLDAKEGEDNVDKILTIKIFGDNQVDPYYFNLKNVKNIYIGRDKLCNIQVDDPLLSRIHCTIQHTDEEGWVIYDGKKDDEDENQNQESTNGVWSYINDETQIYDGLIFKNNRSAFECHIMHST